LKNKINKILIKKITEKDIPKLVDFAAANSYNEYDSLKPNKEELYKNTLDKFIKDKTKSVYYLKDENNNIRGLIFFEALDFDTKLFSLKTFKLTDLIISKRLERKDFIVCAHLLLDMFIKEMKKNKAKFIQCKLDSRNIYVAQVLEEFGFRLASTDITFLRDTTLVEQKPHNYLISLCNEGDVDYLYTMSKETYRTTRFHNDPKISKEQANEMQALWIKNCYYQKLADEIIVIKDGKDICGYVACGIVKNISFSGNKKIGRIILITVDKKFQGKGIGSIVIRESLKWFKNQGCAFVAVGTQLINIPALKFYQKNGFKVESTTLSFHLWM